MKYGWYHLLMVPVSMLTVILAWIALNSPSRGGLLTQYSLLTITSNNSGPSLWMGLGVSCVRITKNATTTCTDFAFNPKYNFSAISNAPIYVLQTPPALLRGLIMFSSILTIVLMVYIWVMLYLYNPDSNQRYRNGLAGLQYLEAFTCLTGALSFWVLQLYFEKTSQNFNEISALLGRSDLNASLGKAFSCAFAGYGFIVFHSIITVVEREQIQPHQKVEEKPPADRELKRKLSKESDKVEVVFMGDKGVLEDKDRAGVYDLKGMFMNPSLSVHAKEIVVNPK